jgi:hypothetical protein
MSDTSERRLTAPESGKVNLELSTLVPELVRSQVARSPASDTPVRATGVPSTCTRVAARHLLERHIDGLKDR